MVAAAAAQGCVGLTVALFVVLQALDYSPNRTGVRVPGHSIVNDFALTPFFCVVKVSATDVALSNATVPVLSCVIVLAPWWRVASCGPKEVFLVPSECSLGWHKKKNPMHIKLAMASMSSSTSSEV